MVKGQKVRAEGDEVFRVVALHVRLLSEFEFEVAVISIVSLLCRSYANT